MSYLDPNIVNAISSLQEVAWVVLDGRSGWPDERVSFQSDRTGSGSGRRTVGIGCG